MVNKLTPESNRQDSSPVLIGAHTSIAGGMEQAYYRGASIGCTALQIFTHSNRQWAMKPLKDETIEAVKKARLETGIMHDVVHASYLINCASPTAQSVIQSKSTLLEEVKNCAQLGIPSLVMHPGSNPSAKEGIAMIADALNELFDADTSQVSILLETMAGQGSQIGSTFEELAEIRQRVTKKERVGFCIDTCHIWAAGYDISKEDSYEKVVHEFDTILGLENLKAMHINDSKKDCNTHVDRHAFIGKGLIGIEGFRILMNDTRLAHVPKVLETPAEELSDYAQDIQTLLGLVR